MTLFLSEKEVVQLLPMGECIQALDEAFAHAGAGQTELRPRSRIRMPNGFFHFMAAADAGHRVFGYKAYPSFSGPKGSKNIVNLFDFDTGELLACMEGGRLGQIRTGAASGLATQYMAREGAASVGVIGSGFQARTQLEAVCAVRTIRQARVFSRRQERREEFATKMSQQLGLEVVAVDSAAACVDGVEIVVAVTSAREPVLEGEWLAPGAHVNAAGGNHWMRREVDEAVVTRSGIIVVDDLEQAKAECGDLIWPEARGRLRWDQAHELQDVVAGRVPGRPSEDAITLFESQGVALEDIAAAQLVYRKAKEQGIGQELPF
ncbi:MAG: ornithine cyclodeaminase family protein [Dehalococcoidia bacterium]|jgi:ornithine cyclodeaminase/alanine dehydrogenase-like protein (mu-crystallin family)|nr:ornithine cyclodeaminase family protein [Dehalococcoidia bacterium]MDP6226102.1 ornithine cyclodeaminase family protein [Dehalococcoidia bacterium]HJN88053.1 ornithine cyclodeaminase family protein [Dehalococcoidia bacterium]